jgi:alanine dehydrogenase
MLDAYRSNHADQNAHALLSTALVLGRRDIAALMAPEDYLRAVETDFRSYAAGGVDVPSPMHIRANRGAFHAKGASIALDRPYVAVKLNGNFPDSPRRAGLPTIRGVALLCDGAHGSVLAAMDSIEITSRRTAAASALAARHLALPEADCVAICGCGEQGRAHLAALADALPLERALVWEIDAGKARRFACEARQEFSLNVDAVAQASEATRGSRVIVTATTARAPFLARDMVSAGTFVAAVGADSPEKSEVAADPMAGATIVVDLLDPAVAMGDLRHAICARTVAREDVHAELAEVVVGRKPGRTRADEVIIFDSTGTAIQDVACAAAIWQRGVGTPFAFGAP